MQFGLALAPVLILAIVLCFLVPVLTRLLRSSRPSEMTTEWFENFHLSNYAPMEGLLARDDFQFLSRQPGFDSVLCKKLRRERLRIFRQYLDRLIVDFNRLYTLAGFVISQGQEDQSRLFANLFALRFAFWKSILRVECSYLLCYLGATPAPLSGLLQHMDTMSKLALRPDAQGLLVN